MPSPRYTQIDIEATPYYHCISRCVRRAFLCGRDHLTQSNFDHRKDWLVEKLAELSAIFAIRICAYAVLSNHFHLVVRIDSERARSWSNAEVVERYGRLFRHPVESWDRLPPAQAADRVACWRARLADLSWFMRCLNESIARRANQEDECAETSRPLISCQSLESYQPPLIQRQIERPCLGRISPNGPTRETLPTRLDNGSNIRHYDLIREA